MPEPSSTVTKSAATTRHGVGVDRRANVERPLVVEADEVGDRDRPDDLGVRRRARPRPGRAASTRSRPPSGRAHPHVLDVGPDGGGDVRRPASTAWSSTRAGRSRASTTREAHVDRRLGDVAVRAGLAELVARQRGAAAAAVRDDLEALVDQARVPHLAEQPPDALDVVVATASSRRRRCRATSRCGSVSARPVLDVAVDRLAAAAVERLDAELLDLRACPRSRAPSRPRPRPGRPWQSQPPLRAT